MKRSSSFAAGFLVLGFLAISFIVLFVEPGMGFATPKDFFDPEKVANGYTSLAWFLGDLFYLTIGIATARIARTSDDRYLIWSALAAGILFFLLGAIDRVAAQLPSLMRDADSAEAGLIALLPIRFAVLKTAAFSLAVFAWRTTTTTDGKGTLVWVWRGFGYVILALGVLFIFIFIPLPIAFFVWAVGLTVKAGVGGSDS
jgi:hypothetical protein